MKDLSSYTSLYPVTIHDVTEGPDSRSYSGKRFFHLTPDAISEFVDALRHAVQEHFGEPTCLLSLQPTAGDTNVEHIILQGLGAHWIKLPRGLVRAGHNNQASKAELRFQREGLMGLLRPFYVGSDKEWKVDLADGTTFRFSNNHSTGVKFEIIEPEGAPPRSLGIPDEAGPSVLRFMIPVKIAEPCMASIALHKLAYLTLCLVEPTVAFQEGFQPVREFVLGNRGYRPYAEKFIPGAAPGFAADIWIVRTEGSGEVRRVITILRLHHVEYHVTLVGPDVPPDAVPEKLAGTTRNVTLEWKMESICRMQVEPDASGRQN